MICVRIIETGVLIQCDGREDAIEKWWAEADKVIDSDIVEVQ